MAQAQPSQYQFTDCFTAAQGRDANIYDTTLDGMIQKFENLNFYKRLIP